VIASSRVHTLPLLLLLTVPFMATKHWRSLLPLLAAGLFVFGWTLIALLTTVDFRVTIGESSENVILFYLLKPFTLLEVIGRTVSNDGLRGFYVASFFGILGWLDTRFEAWQYTTFAVMVGAVAALTIAPKRILNEWPARLLLLAIAVASVFLTFLALLITWTPHPAEVISGIQGRYFLIPAIALAYGISSHIGQLHRARRFAAAGALLVLFVFSLLATVDRLVNRYYLVDYAVESDVIMVELAEPGEQSALIAGAALAEDSPISLRFPPLGELIVGEITRVGVLFGTHVRSNRGEAELVLFTRGGAESRQRFVLAGLVDNAYHSFRVPAGDYVSGELRFVSGGGVSVWELYVGGDARSSCMTFDTDRYERVVLAGCP
jgi:hypothetical protein